MLTLKDFKEARGVLSGVIRDTPLVYSPAFSKATGNQVYIKPENMQLTGAYKIRGAYYKISTLSDEEKARGLVTASAGNHAQGVAYAAQHAGVEATIVMPTTTPLVKVNNTKDYGAKVVLHGETFDDAAELAARLAQEEGLTYVHPFNDPALATGQGTISYEIFQDLPDVDVILVPIGGGGLGAMALNRGYTRHQNIVLWGAVILLVILFLLYKQPHMSGMILVCSGAAAVLFASGIRLYWFVGGGAAVGAALLFLITQTEYMTARMQSWLNPGSDLRGDGYQLWQSQIAIGSGGLLGTGLGNSRQKYMFLPEEHNDFVFAIVCEELGLIGACLIIILFALLIIRGYWLALHARDRFGSLMIVGVNTQLAAQVILNIGVVTGALPTTGISLPFFSYGGTALVVQLAEVGLILAVSRQIVAPKEE